MKTCLIVDDVEVSRYVGHTFIEALGFNVIESFGKESCLNALKGNNIDVVLLDWHLKKENGLELIPLLRQAKGENLPIIVFSGVENEKNRQDALKAGANAFLEKPTEKEKIEAAFKMVGVL